MIRVDTVGSAPMRIGGALPERSWRNGIEPLPQRRQRRPGMAQKHLAVTRDLDAATVALENVDAQDLFQLPDRLGHRRLADMQQFGRLHDAFLPRDLDKGLQMAELDAAIDHGYHNPGS